MREATYADPDAQSASQHPHVGAGSPAGGQFATKGSGSGLGSMPSPPRSSSKRTSSKSKGSLPPPPVTARTMKLGDRGDDVRNLQYALGLLGFDVSQNGQFDHSTENAIKAAQQRLGLNPTGHAGSGLLRKLQDAVRLSPCVKESTMPRAAALITRALESLAECKPPHVRRYLTRR